MIVWLASYPRSGNTFLRIVVHRLSGYGSAAVYPVDGVRERLGNALVADDPGPRSLAEARDSPAVHFVKTHRRRSDDVAETDRALYLVRDGRDALVSFARQRAEGDPRRYCAELEALILRRHGGTAGWGGNVLSWLPPPDAESTAPVVVIRFEDLVADPVGVVTGALRRVAPDLAVSDTPVVPTFDQLHQEDPGFFRRGVTGTHRDELPTDLEELFWSIPDNRTAMSRLGHGSR